MTRNGRYHNIKGVFGLSAKRNRICKWANDLHLFDYRSWPAMSDDDRQCILLLRANMNKMNIHSVYRRNKLRQGVQPGLYFSPVVLACPVFSERFHCSELYSLGC